LPRDRSSPRPFPLSARAPKLVGMVHLDPLPGSPRPAALPRMIARALADARAWAAGGADALLVENYGDQPFRPETVEPVTIAAMARVIAALRAESRLPIGVNVLRNDARGALALAAAFDLAFFRVNVHAGASVADQGLLVGRADATLRERAALRSNALLFADVRVKHAAPLAPRRIEDEARDLFERAGADALLLTGPATGSPPDLDHLDALRRALPRAPLLLASGVDPDLIAASRGKVAGWIVGTWAKRGGRVANPVDAARVRQLVRARDGARDRRR
jgi:membrane complex biogenesis BtpA family protein